MTLVHRPELLFLSVQVLLKPSLFLLELLVLLPDHLQVPAHCVLQLDAFVAFYFFFDLLNALQLLVKEIDLVLELFNTKGQGIVLLDQRIALHLFQLVANQQVTLLVNILLVLFFCL
jgi:hypothetical protein